MTLSALLVLMQLALAPVTTSGDRAVASTVHARAVSAGVDHLGWLEGVWRSDDFETRYTSAAGGMILSTSKWLGDGKVQYFEFERFEPRNNSVVLVPYPGGKASVEFTLASIDTVARRAVFENRKHDFPNEIVYHRVDASTLYLRVSGVEQRKPRVLELNLRRVE